MPCTHASLHGLIHGGSVPVHAAEQCHMQGCHVVLVDDIQQCPGIQDGRRDLVIPSETEMSVAGRGTIYIRQQHCFGVDIEDRFIFK